MPIVIKMESHAGPLLAYELLQRPKTVRIGDTAAEVPGGFKISLQAMAEQRAFDVPSTLVFIVDAAVNIDIGLFSAWLYDKCQNRGVSRILIADENIPLSKEDIEKELRKALQKLDG